MINISLTELKMNTGKYVELAGREAVFITKNGRRVAKLIAATPDKMAAAESLIGLLPPDIDLDQARKDRLS